MTINEKITIYCGLLENARNDFFDENDIIYHDLKKAIDRDWEHDYETQRVGMDEMVEDARRDFSRRMKEAKKGGGLSGRDIAESLIDIIYLTIYIAKHLKVQNNNLIEYFDYGNDEVLKRMFIMIGNQRLYLMEVALYMIADEKHLFEPEAFSRGVIINSKNSNSHIPSL